MSGAAHAHHHDHGHGGHHHHHGHAHAPVANGDWRFLVGMAFNILFVAVEAGFGFWANSTALLADAGHNLSDVLGLALAGGAAWLARRAVTARRTYGFGKATVLAALTNAIFLVFACGAIAFEAIGRFAQPHAVPPKVVMLVAAAGFVANLATALLFMRGRGHDLNVKGAFLHMISDAAVSLGVVFAGAVIFFTGWTWVDPATSLVIVLVILVGTWGLLRESVDLAMDAAPARVDMGEVREFLLALPGVGEVHDVHVWNMSTTETALTAHLVRADMADDAFLGAALESLRHRFGIAHATLQVETDMHEACPHC